MRRDILFHLSFWLFTFLIISFFKGLLIPVAWPFWFGGVVGLILPEVDHLIYIFFLRPQDLTSQRFHFLLERKKIVRSIELLYETHGERSGLIFHSLLFQIIFFALSFLVFTSSSTLFAKGLTFSFLLHLFVDQLMDIRSSGDLQGWMQYMSFPVSSSLSKLYLVISFLIICMFAFLL
jgi:hypothetical protein